MKILMLIVCVLFLSSCVESIVSVKETPKLRFEVSIASDSGINNNIILVHDNQTGKEYITRGASGDMVEVQPTLREVNK